MLKKNNAIAMASKRTKVQHSGQDHIPPRQRLTGIVLFTLQDASPL